MSRGVTTLRQILFHIASTWIFQSIVMFNILLKAQLRCLFEDNTMSVWVINFKLLISFKVSEGEIGRDRDPRAKNSTEVFYIWGKVLNMLSYHLLPSRVRQIAGGWEEQWIWDSNVDIPICDVGVPNDIITTRQNSTCFVSFKTFW